MAVSQTDMNDDDLKRFDFNHVFEEPPEPLSNSNQLPLHDVPPHGIGTNALMNIPISGPPNNEDIMLTLEANIAQSESYGTLRMREPVWIENCTVRPIRTKSTEHYSCAGFPVIRMNDRKYALVFDLRFRAEIIILRFSGPAHSCDSGT